MEIDNCVVVIKETALSQSSRAARFARSGDATARRLIHAHDEHNRTADAVRKSLARRGVKFKELSTARLSTAGTRRRLAEADFIITVGGDGTALNSSHYVREGRLLAVNSAPRDSIGHFCFAHRSNFDEKLNLILTSRLRPIKLARLEVALDDKPVTELALNDVLITHECPAATTRYIIEIDGRAEEHRSSGLWVSTAAGSTAGIKSAGGRVLRLGSRRMQYLIRELYRERGRSYAHRRGLLEGGEGILVASKMPEGMLYVDGWRTSYRFPFGMRARIRIAETSLKIYLNATRGG
ncbi:MAG TPA: NAD(+)/NADH kinase [Blastocatellia bacterium]|nr:NAD(+)/NADH kinase [Blastocatellia bacterium]